MIIEKEAGASSTRAQLPDLESKSPQERIDWAISVYPEKLLLTTSFGAQSAAFLHLATQAKPDLPIVFIDTGYHFPETLEFAKLLTEKLGLNLQTYRPSKLPPKLKRNTAVFGKWGQTAWKSSMKSFGLNPFKEP